MMNKRIQELAREAGFGVRQDDVYTAKLEHLPITENMEKFAELIVQECFYCVDIMEKIAHSTSSSIPEDYDKHTYIETLTTLRGLLKVHFNIDTYDEAGGEAGWSSK